MSYMKLNQQPQATRAFEQALKLEPGSSGPYVQLGTLYLKQGKKDRALEAFKKAIAAGEADEKRREGLLAAAQAQRRAPHHRRLPRAGADATSRWARSTRRWPR